MEKRKQKYRKTSKGIGRKIMHTLAARVVIVVFFCLGATELSGEAGNSTLRSLRRFSSLVSEKTSAIQGR